MINSLPLSTFKISAVAFAVIVAGCSNNTKVTTEDNVLEKTSSSKALLLTEQPITPSSQWNLVWNDEFNGTKIDMTKWGFEENCWGGGNNEQQCYTNRASNAFVESGILNIVAKKETFTGPDNPDGKSAGTKTLPYTSARLRTMNKGDWKYGRFDIRAKLPKGQGTWPAIWMLPTDWVYGGWAASGEIDIMEAVNISTPSTEKGATEGEPETRVFGTLHYGQPWPKNVFTGQAVHLPGKANPADGFHTYSIEWEEGEIRWYIDNIHFATQRQNGWYSQHSEDGKMVSGGDNAPFNQKFHMLLNLAVGGGWAANANNGGIDKSVFPQTLSVDYVRVYSCDADPKTGKGCASISDKIKVLEGIPEPKILTTDINFAKGPIFNVYDDALSNGIAFDGYDPDNNISQQEVDDPNHGKVWQITKAGDTGNVYLRIPKTDMSDWMKDGQLVFDLKIDSNKSKAGLLVKMDSGWPNVSDMKVTQPALGTWGEVRINVADLIASDNSYSAGNYAKINEIINLLVLEPLGEMTLNLDNIRFEQQQK
ncbi:glycoside hydrolase family 16 protein [Psychromonas sp. PT13]|uniref:glycoside hydrolase family 16 protein n=1 Tax=Psychromonas sp. PT13 TaxID=3439547 RepID=UPI003EBE0319